jgi:hypothetical protein
LDRVGTDDERVCLKLRLELEDDTERESRDGRCGEREESAPAGGRRGGWGAKKSDRVDGGVFEHE